VKWSTYTHCCTYDKTRDKTPWTTASWSSRFYTRGDSLVLFTHLKNNCMAATFRRAARMPSVGTDYPVCRQKSFTHFFTKCDSFCGPSTQHLRGFQIILGHNTLGKTPLDAEPSTWQHNTNDRHPRPRKDSNLQFQQRSGRWTTPQTGRPLGIRCYRVILWWQTQIFVKIGQQ